MDLREGVSRDEITGQVVEDALAVLQAMHGVATPLLCQLDVTMSQVKTLLTISLHGEATIGFIAHTMQTGLPAASTTVDRLLHLGWVNRSEDPADRRRAIVTLTPAGRDVVETVWRLRRDLLREWLSRMELQDLATLARGIATLKEAALAPQLDETDLVPARLLP